MMISLKELAGNLILENIHKNGLVVKSFKSEYDELLLEIEFYFQNPKYKNVDSPVIQLLYPLIPINLINYLTDLRELKKEFFRILDIYIFLLKNNLKSKHSILESHYDSSIIEVAYKLSKYSLDDVSPVFYYLSIDPFHIFSLTKMITLEYWIDTIKKKLKN